MTTVFFNGQFIDETLATIPATSRAGLFGEGVFTTMLVDDGEVQFFESHLSRLKKDAGFIGLTFPKIDIEDVKTLISINNLKRGKARLRITLFSNETAKFDSCKLKNGCFPPSFLKPVDILIHLIPIESEEHKDLELCIYPEVVSTSLSKVKTLNYLNRFIIKKHAIERGFDDALVLGPENMVLETSFSNILWIDKTTVFLPDSSLPYFRGTTLDLVLKELSISGYRICEGFFELKDIPESAYVYLCSSLKKFICVRRIEERIFQTKRYEENQSFSF